MDKKTRIKSKWVIAGLPVAGMLGAGLLPLHPFAQQALICAMLIWFQISLMVGFFS